MATKQEIRRLKAGKTADDIGDPKARRAAGGGNVVTPALVDYELERLKLVEIGETPEVTLLEVKDGVVVGQSTLDRLPTKDEINSGLASINTSVGPIALNGVINAEKLFEESVIPEPPKIDYGSDAMRLTKMEIETQEKNVAPPAPDYGSVDARLTRTENETQNRNVKPEYTGPLVGLTSDVDVRPTGGSQMTTAAVTGATGGDQHIYATSGGSVIAGGQMVAGGGKVMGRAVSRMPPKMVAISIPRPEDWNYKNPDGSYTKFGPRGQDLPDGATSWTPTGTPFFGDGVVGKLKSMWWTFSDPVPNTATVAEMSDLWNKAKEYDRSINSSVAGRVMGTEDNVYRNEFTKNIVEAFSGRGAQLSAEESMELSTLTAKRNAKGIQLNKDELVRWDELTKGSVDQSVLSGVTRLVNAVKMPALDAFNYAAILTKQAAGSWRASTEELMRQAGDSALVKYDPEVVAQEKADFFEMSQAEYLRKVNDGFTNPYLSRYSSPLADERAQVAENNLKVMLNNTIGILWNRVAIEFKGGMDFEALEKAQAQGYDAGRILYSGVLDPMLRYDFETRLRQGENAELLAMELANPWAEMVGELIFDPLNLIGMGTKGAKVASKIQDGERMVEPMSKMLINSFDEAADAAKALGAGTADEAAIRIMDKVAKEGHAANQARYAADVQKYLPNDKIASSLVETRKREVSNFIGNMVSSMKKDGRTDGDIAEIIKYGVMSVSENLDEARVGYTSLLSAGVPKAFYSELGSDVLRTVRGMITSDSPLEVAQIALKMGTASPDAVKLIDDVADAMAAQKAGKATEEQIELLSKATFKKVDGGALQKALSAEDELSQAGKQYQAAKALGAGGTKKQQALVEAVQKAEEAAAAGTASKAELKMLSNVTAKTDGKLEAIIELGNKAAGKQFASVAEMRKAADEVAAARDIGGTITRKQQALADAYLEVPASVKQMEKLFVGPQAVKGAINAGLGTFYFTLNPGTAVRNVLSNNMFMAMDNGISSLVKSTDAIQGQMLKHFGKEIGAGETFGSQAGGLSAKLAEIKFPEKMPLIGGISPFNLMGPGEKSAAIKTLGARYMDAFSKLTDVRLPFDELGVAGMNAADFKLYKEFIKQEGNIAEANKLMMEVLDAGGDWRNLDFISPEYVRGFKQHGSTWDEILEMTRDPNITPEAVEKWAQGKMKEMEKVALTAADDVPGVEKGSWMADELALWQETGQISDADIVKHSQYLNAAEQARHSYQFEVRKQLQLLDKADPVIATKFRKATADLFEAESRLFPQQQKYLKGMWETINATAKEVNKGDLTNLTKAWNSLGIEKKMPSVIEDAVDEMFSFGRLKSAGMHEGRYKSYYEKADAIIEEWKVVAQELDMDVAQLERAFDDAQALSAKSEQIRSAVFNRGTGKGYTGSPPVGTKLGAMDSDAVHALLDELGVKGGYKRLLNSVNKDLRTAAGKVDEVGKAVKQYEKWQDVPWNEAVTALGKRIEDFPPSKPLISPSVPGAPYSTGRLALETQKGYAEALQSFVTGVKDRWGVKSATDPKLPQALAEYATKYGNDITDAKSAAMTTAEYWRDFTLLGYGTDRTYADLAASYAMPYAFWYKGTYRNTLERLVTDPQVIAGYAKYKKAMETEHAMLPEWYRQQVNLSELIGVETDNPLFFDLERTLNPLIGLTGVDFTDESKRVNRWTATLDDMGKFGPSIWAPIQWATAAFGVGNDADARQRWAGRVMPQSPMVKAISSLTTGKQLEIDPAVLLTGGREGKGIDWFGAMDAYETGRTGRALASVEERLIGKILGDPTIPAEQKEFMISETRARMLEVAKTHEGPEWDEAYKIATNLRAWGQIASPLLGVGFKARTTVDLELDEMYTQMNTLMAMRDDITSDEYQDEWARLRDQFPFMDTVLLSRKPSDERDGAYAYNVLSRLPPGTQGAYFKDRALTDLKDRFYADNGDMSGWTDQDKETWNNEIKRLGSLLQIPNETTKEDWAEAKDAYQRVVDEMGAQWGVDIMERITAYYDENDPGKRKAILSKDPAINDALNYQYEQVARDWETLGQYYGSLEGIVRSAGAEYMEKLKQEFGEDIVDLSNAYGTLVTSKANWESMSAADRAAEKRMFVRMLEAYEGIKAEGSTESLVDFIAHASKSQYKDTPENMAVGGVTYRYDLVKSAKDAIDARYEKQSAEYKSRVSLDEYREKQAATAQWDDLTANKKRARVDEFNKQVAAWEKIVRDNPHLQNYTFKEFAASEEGNISNFLETDAERRARIAKEKAEGYSTPREEPAMPVETWDNLENYWDNRYTIERSLWEKDTVDGVYETLPDKVEFRKDPETELEVKLANLVQDRGITPDVVWNAASPELKGVVSDYFYDGDPLPQVAREALQDMAADLNMSENEVLVVMGVFLGDTSEERPGEQRPK